MPHKYEREIEEILRNIESPEPPRKGLGDRVRAFQRPPARPRPRPRGPALPPLRLTLTERLILGGIALTLIAAGLAYYRQTPDLISGLLALLAFAVIVAGLVNAWSKGFGSGRITPTWRGSVVDAKPTPLAKRRGPFGELATQVRILRLKLRYWRSRER